MDGSVFSSILAVAAWTLIWGVLAQVSNLKKRTVHLEGKLDLLLKNAGLKYDPYAGVSEEIAYVIKSGNKIKAIKLHREATGAGLKEAKELGSAC